MTTADVKTDRRRTRWLRTLSSALALCLLLAVGCGESPELRIEKAQIALANGKPSTAQSIIDTVLAEEPDNRQALLIQATAQVDLGRLRPAKLTLDRLQKDQPDDLSIARALLSWAHQTVGLTLNDPTFAVDAQAQERFSLARSVAVAQLKILKQQPDTHVESLFGRALLHQSDSQRLRLLIQQTRRSIQELGPDSAAAGLEQDPQEEPADPPTYAQLLEQQQDALNTGRENLLTDLESVLAEDPRHTDAALLFLRTAKDEQAWDRLIAQARELSGVTDLPLVTAHRTISALLGMPEDAAAIDERVQLGWDLLRAIPADESESPVKRIASARLLLVEGKIDQALPILETLRGDGSLNFDAHFLLAQALFSRGDYERCREVMSPMFPTMASVARVQALYGLTLWNLGELDQARLALRTACELDPQDPMARDAFTTMMTQEGFIGASGEDIEAYYRLDPTNPRALLFKLQRAMASGDTDQVARLLDGIEAGSDLTDDQVRMLFFGYDFLGRTNAARKWAGEWVGRQPGQLDVWMRLATVLLKQGDEAGLENVLAQIAKRFPDAPGPEQLTGELYYKSKQYERAAAALGMAVEKAPDNHSARLALSRSLAAMGRFKSATQQVQTVLQAMPNDIDALALGARIANAADQPEQADEYLSRIDADQVDPEVDPALAARLKLRAGDLDAAADICTQAIASGNLSPMLRLVLAGIYQEQDQPKRAEEHLLALVRLYPNSAEPFSWLSQFYIRQDLTDQGVKQLEEMEVYNEVFARLSQATLLRAADRGDEAVAALNPLLDKLIRQRDPSAPMVADAIAKLHTLLGDEDAATDVFDRLYNNQSQGSASLITQLLSSWDQDSLEKRLANLDAASARVSAGDTASVTELSRRYAMLGRPDQALSVVQRGLTQSPKSTALLGIKAGLLVMLGRTEEAVDVYRSVIELVPQDRAVRVRYARALSADGRYPQAEEALLDLIRTADSDDQLARTAQLEIYQTLGLEQRAASVVDAVQDKTPPGQDVGLDHAIGRTLLTMDRYDEALHRLAAIGPGSPYYASAQVLSAKGEVAAGDMQAAGSRIGSLYSDPTIARQVTAQMLKLSQGSDRDAVLLSWADSSIDLDSLPRELSEPWLGLRLKLADRQGDWALAGDTLDRLSGLGAADDGPITALRIVLLYQGGQHEQARQFLADAPRLAGTATGSLLAYGLGVDPPSAGRRHPMTQIVEALAQGDRAGVDEAARGYQAVRTLFPDDLIPALDHEGKPVVNDQPQQAGCDLVMATAALEAGMSGLSSELSGSAINRAPGYVPGYALLAAVTIGSGNEVTGLLQQTQKVAPDSSLVLLLTAVNRRSAGDHRGAVEPLRELSARHGDDPHLAYQLAQQLNEAAMHPQAIEALKAMVAGDGPYRLVAANDLAYLLAEQGPEHYDEAARLARSVLEAIPASPAVLDTAGWIEHRRGHDQAALKLLSHAIPMLSQIHEAHYHIGAVYQALGQDRWARYHLEHAASGPDDAGGVAQARDLLKQMGDATDWP